MFQYGSVIAGLWVIGLLIYRTTVLDDFFEDEQTRFQKCSVDDDCFQIYVYLEVFWGISFLIAGIAGIVLTSRLQKQAIREVADNDDDYVDEADVLEEAELVDLANNSGNTINQTSR